VITGGAAGIGLAVAQRLAASGATSRCGIGMRLALEAAKAAIAGVKVTHALDVADADAVARAAGATAEALGRIDVLVCSAGITGPNVPTWEYPVDAWRQVMDVNLNGLFYCNRAVVPVMLKNEYGRIVNIASVAGKEGNPNASAYSTSKAAVIGLTKSLGKELAKNGHPRQLRDAAAVRTAIFDQMTQQHIDFMLSKIPMGRFGAVEEIAALVAGSRARIARSRRARFRRVGRARDVLASVSSHREHDLADVLRGLHQRVRGGGLGQREHLMDDVFTLPLSSIGQTFSRSAFASANLRSAGLARSVEPGDGQAPHHDVPPVDLDAAALQKGNHDEPALER
jgi:3-oxoacyl-[acyl-carrier protein] reductase